MSKTLAEIYAALEERSDELDETRDRAQRELERIEKKMYKLENEWMQDHSCSCELVGIRCQHTEV